MYMLIQNKYVWQQSFSTITKIRVFNWDGGGKVDRDNHYPMTDKMSCDRANI